MLFTNYFMTISNIIAIIYFTIVSSTCLSAKRLQVIDLQPFLRDNGALPSLPDGDIRL